MSRRLLFFTRFSRPRLAKGSGFFTRIFKSQTPTIIFFQKSPLLFGASGIDSSLSRIASVFGAILKISFFSATMARLARNYFRLARLRVSARFLLDLSRTSVDQTDAHPDYTRKKRSAEAPRKEPGFSLETIKLGTQASLFLAIGENRRSKAV